MESVVDQRAALCPTLIVINDGFEFLAFVLRSKRNTGGCSAEGSGTRNDGSSSSILPGSVALVLGDLIMTGTPEGVGPLDEGDACVV